LSLRLFIYQNKSVTSEVWRIGVIARIQGLSERHAMYTAAIF
jgi:hypothetical protein